MCSNLKTRGLILRNCEKILLDNVHIRLNDRTTEGSRKEVADSVKDIDSLNDLSSYYMCSPTCPCLQPSEATIEGWSDEQNWLNIEEKVLKGLERTKEVETATFFNLMVFYTAE